MGAKSAPLQQGLLSTSFFSLFLCSNVMAMFLRMDLDFFVRARCLSASLSFLDLEQSLTDAAWTSCDCDCCLSFFSGCPLCPCALFACYRDPFLLFLFFFLLLPLVVVAVVAAALR
jgi:hypothetical protein